MSSWWFFTGVDGKVPSLLDVGRAFNWFYPVVIAQIKFKAKSTKTIDELVSDPPTLRSHDELGSSARRRGTDSTKEGVVCLRARLKSLEQRANERAERKNEEACACVYVETTDGEEPTEEAVRVVASNLLCEGVR